MSCANPEPLVALEPSNIFFARLRVLECANAGNVPLWTVCCLHTRRPLEDCHLVVTDLLSSTQKKVRLCLGPFVSSPRCPSIPLAVVIPPRLPNPLSPRIFPFNQKEKI